MLPPSSAQICAQMPSRHCAFCRKKFSANKPAKSTSVRIRKLHALFTQEDLPVAARAQEACTATSRHTMAYLCLGGRALQAPKINARASSGSSLPSLMSKRSGACAARLHSMHQPLHGTPCLSSSMSSCCPRWHC